MKIYPALLKLNSIVQMARIVWVDCSTKAYVQKSGKRRKSTIWSPEIKQLFEECVSKLGKEGTPAQILKEMGPVGISRTQVASFLQKYRAKSANNKLSLSFVLN